MRWLRPYHLTVTERKGFAVLLIVLFLLIAVRLALAFWPVQPVENQSTLLEEMAAWRHEQRQALLVSKSFDPNTVADSIILQFKLPSYAAENWLKYRNRGRRFENPDDILYIYGVDTMWFEVNRDSIVIADDNPHIAHQKKFFFDPNTASREELLEVGMPAYLADRILKYRTAGGSFTSPDDLKKIYGFPDALFAELRPFIKISTIPELEKNNREGKEKEVRKVNLNQCDSLQLLDLPGIGPTFAGRILKYRRQLGGYYKAEQLLEVYGFNEDKLNRIVLLLEVNADEIEKISVNKATFKQLLAHPYLNYNQVKQIVNYREKMGTFKNLDGLAQLQYFSINDVERLRPYLLVE